MNTNRRILTMDEIKTVFEHALEDFNYSFDYDFSADNFVIQGIDGGENREKVFEDFCRKYFPFRLKDNYKSKDYYDFLASAFPGRMRAGKQGILIRTDIESDESEIYNVMLHELAHIYCVHNELGGKIFYDEYCENYAEDAETDGQINAGYAVWRELAADIVAVQCLYEIPAYSLCEKKEIIKGMMLGINAKEAGKLYLSKLLFEVMICEDVATAKTWEQAKSVIENSEIFDNPMYMDLLEMVFCKLRSGTIKIDLEFIMRLGFLYLEIITFSSVDKWMQSFKEQKRI